MTTQTTQSAAAKPPVPRCEPYLPDGDRLRAAWPAGTPLPAYLLPEFQQGLDRTRPLQYEKDPAVEKRGLLRYRYTDTDETVIVPNCPYTQTHEMRLTHWAWEVARAEERVGQTGRQLDEAHKAMNASPHSWTARNAERSARDDHQRATARLAEIKRVAADVQAGRLPM